VLDTAVAPDSLVISGKRNVQPMNDKAGNAGKRRFPFLDHIGLAVREHEPGSSICALTVAPFHFNSSGLVHGAVIFALADTGMGAALMGTLEEGEGFATVELQINYFKPVQAGELTCTTQLVNRGRTLANLESSIYLGETTLVARATGNFAIFRRETRVGGDNS
jgi:acyl-CoA thioesterase